MFHVLNHLSLKYRKENGTEYLQPSKPSEKPCKLTPLCESLFDIPSPLL